MWCLGFILCFCTNLKFIWNLCYYFASGSETCSLQSRRTKTPCLSVPRLLATAHRRPTLSARKPRAPVPLIFAASRPSILCITTPERSSHSRTASRIFCNTNESKVPPQVVVLYPQTYRKFHRVPPQVQQIQFVRLGFSHGQDVP